MRMRALGRIAAATALAAIASLLTTSGASAADPAPVPLEVTFNDPTKTAPRPAGVSPSAWGDQNAVRDQLVDLVNRSENGSLIRGSLYLFTDGKVRDALKAAHARQVRVQLVLDGDAVPLVNSDGKATGTEFHALAAALGKVEYGQTVDPNATGSFVLGCPPDRGCIGNRDLGKPAINHNKFFLFSRVGTTENVVFQTSANLTSSQQSGHYNNAVTIPDNGSGLYAEYDRYWQQQVAHGTQGAGLEHNYTSKQSGAYKTYFFPRMESDMDSSGGPGDTVDPREEAKTDTIVSLLSNADCTVSAPKTQIRVAMYAFTRTQVAEKLVALQKSGCEVQVVTNGDDGNLGAEAGSILASGGLKTLRECAGTEAGSKGVHSKYMIIEGTYLGGAGRKVVFTGSHNYTYPNLRATDETLLKIDSSSVYDRFKANFDTTLLGSVACQRAYGTTH